MVVKMAEEKERLYPNVPISIIPIIVVTFLILTILFFDVRGGYQTNPVIFYALPFLYLFVFLVRDTAPVLIKTMGLYMPTLRAKIVGIVSIPLGLLLGWVLVKFSRAAPHILPVSTFPWVASSYATAGIGMLSTLSTTSNFFLYLTVAIFEEGTALYLGKNMANFLYDKGMKNTILACLFGLFTGRIILTSHHWFSYLGFQQPYLYFSAFMLFSIFTLGGILTGLIAHGRLKNIGDLKIVPVLMPIMLCAHFAFDFTMSTLTIL